MSWYVFMERMTDMFQNNRKTIGVFAEGVRYEFQRKLCQGIIEEAEKMMLGQDIAKLNEKNFALSRTKQTVK